MFPCPGRPGSGVSPAVRSAVIAPPRTADGPLLLADIGGYTGFLRNVQTAHADDAFANGAVPDAYGLVSSLLDAIVGRLVPPFTLSKLEGDAVFAYAAGDAAIPRGDALLGCIQACYDDFRRAPRRGARGLDLPLRCVHADRPAGAQVHRPCGPLRHPVDRRHARSSSAPEVVMAHRLLKNDAAARRSGPAPTRCSRRRAVERFGVPVEDALPMTAEYEHYEPVGTCLFRLRPTADRPTARSVEDDNQREPVRVLRG